MPRRAIAAEPELPESESEPQSQPQSLPESLPESKRRLVEAKNLNPLRSIVRILRPSRFVSLIWIYFLVFLAGQIHRGVGERLRAVILCSDLRGFTRMSDRLPGEEVIELLDDYFERITEPVHKHGGDVLTVETPGGGGWGAP